MQGSLPQAILSAESKVSDFGRSLLRKFQKFQKVEKRRVNPRVKKNWAEPFKHGRFPQLLLSIYPQIPDLKVQFLRKVKNFKQKVKKSKI